MVFFIRQVPLIFLIYVNGIAYEVKSDLLYGGDSCLIFQQQHVQNFKEYQMRTSQIFVMGSLITN